MGNNKIIQIATVIGISLFATGCVEKGASSTIGGKVDQAIDQSSVCEIQDWRANTTSSCKPGQKVVFLPRSWGNEQLPIIFAAVNCDLRYSVAHTRGAVTCIYAPIKQQPDSAASSASQ